MKTAPILQTGMVFVEAFILEVLLGYDDKRQVPAAAKK